MCFLIDMVNVSLELKDPKGKESAGSLARYGFNGTILLLVTNIIVTVLQTIHVFCFSAEQKLPRRWSARYFLVGLHGAF